MGVGGWMMVVVGGSGAGLVVGRFWLCSADRCERCAVLLAAADAAVVVAAAPALVDLTLAGGGGEIGKTERLISVNVFGDIGLVEYAWRR